MPGFSLLPQPQLSAIPTWCAHPGETKFLATLPGLAGSPLLGDLSPCSPAFPRLLTPLLLEHKAQTSPPLPDLPFVMSLGTRHLPTMALMVSVGYMVIGLASPVDCAFRDRLLVYSHHWPQSPVLCLTYSWHSLFTDWMMGRLGGCTASSPVMNTKGL